VLQARSLSVEVGGRLTLADASFSLRAGDKVGLVGRNGVGKTSLLKVLAGEADAAGGVVLRPDATGYLPQDPRPRGSCVDATGLAHVLSGRGLDAAALKLEALRVRVDGDPTDRNVARFARAEESFRVAGGYAAESEARRLAHGLGLPRDRLDLPLTALSGGERRRVEIARALATRPSYMLLDEPFAGIDPIAVGDIQALVRHLTNRGIGVLITDHNVRETLGLTDRAYIIYSGEVLMEGRTQEIVNNPEVRRLYLGENFSL
jgi:lipopolysaccharide export system ATP-binding protein